MDTDLTTDPAKASYNIGTRVLTITVRDRYTTANDVINAGTE